MRANKIFRFSIVNSVIEKLKIKRNKALFLTITLGVFIVSMYFSNFRFTNIQAIKTSTFYHKNFVFVDSFKYKSTIGHIYKDKNKYITFIVKKHGPFFKGYTHSRYDNQLKVKNISWLYDKDKNLISVLSTDPKVSYIEVEYLGIKTRKYIKGEKPVYFMIDSNIYSNELNMFACSKDGKNLYRYGYEKIKKNCVEKYLDWINI